MLILRKLVLHWHKLCNINYDLNTFTGIEIGSTGIGISAVSEPWDEHCMRLLLTTQLDQANLQEVTPPG